MVDTEDYFMLKDLAREQEQTIGRINISELSRETGFDRKTVRHYLSQDRPPEAPRTRNKPSKLDPYKPYIIERLEKYPRLSRIRFFEEIQKQGYDGKPTILGGYLRQIRPRIPVLPEIRYETPPGEMIQCDWLEYFYSRPDGSEKKVYGFSMVLGYSRMRYVVFSRSQDIQAFLEGHLRAFEYFGGISKVILYDNLRSVVLKRKFPSTASEFHPAFVDLRDHFGFTSRLCRINRAKTKGKVERSNGYIKDNFLYGREFNSIEELNLQAQEWLDVVNRKIHGTTHEIPFDRLPQENLRQFTSYPLYICQKTYPRKVSSDCYISLYGNLYSVPWRYARRYVDVVIRNNTLFVFADEIEICFHPLVEGKDRRSRKNEHFAGLLKKILDEPCQNLKKKRVKKPCTDVCSVEERNLADYDALIEGEISYS